MKGTPVIGMTHAGGLVGRAILDACLQAGYAQIRVLDGLGSLSHADPRVILCAGDPADPFSLETFLDPVDVLIHLPGDGVSGGDISIPWRNDPVRDTANLVNQAIQCGTGHVIHLSSALILGPLATGDPSDETSPFAGADAGWPALESCYLSELEIWRGMEEGIPVTVLNPAIVLAPEMGDPRSRHWLSRLLDGQVGFPGGSLGFVDVRDLALAVVARVGAVASGERILLTGGSLPYADLIREYARSCGRQAPARWVPGLLSRWKEQLRRWAGLPAIPGPVFRMFGSERRFSAHRATERYAWVGRSLKETLADLSAFGSTNARPS